MAEPKPEYGPPRNGIIFFFVVLSVLTLASLKPAFDSYYDSMHTGAVQDRLETYSDLGDVDAARARWASSLRGIDQSITDFAEGRPGLVRPQAGAEMNLDPLVGWNQLPQAVPDRAQPEPEPEVIEDETLSPDAIDALEELAPTGEPDEAPAE